MQPDDSEVGESNSAIGIEQYDEKVEELRDLDSYGLTATDVEPLIGYFASIGSYREAPMLLREAKLQYIRRIGSFAECLQGLQYLKSLSNLPDYEKTEEQLVRRAIQYRTADFQYEGIAPPTSEMTNMSELCAAVTELIASVRRDDDPDRYDAFDRDIIESCRREAVRLIDTCSENMIQNEADPVMLRRLETLIEDMPDDIMNTQKIRREIAMQIGHVEANLRKERKWRIRRIVLISLLATVLLGFIVGGIVGCGCAIRSSYSAEHISVRVLSKTNDADNCMMYGGETLVYAIRLSLFVENRGTRQIHNVKGLMDINNAEGKTMTTVEITLPCELEAGESGTYDVCIKISDEQAGYFIWNTVLDHLQITFKMTSVFYANGAVKQYKDAKNIVINAPEV